MSAFLTYVTNTFNGTVEKLGFVKKDNFHPTGVFSKIKENIKKALTRTVKRYAVNELKAEMETFREARYIAEHPLLPNRKPLLALYHNISIDDQIVTQRRVALNTIIRAPFQIVDQKGKPNKDLDKLLRRPWFHAYLRHDVDSEFYGHSLMEFNPEMTNGEFNDIVLFPREFVRPEFGDALSRINDTSGVLYRDNKEYPYLLEIGDVDDLGILLYCTIPAIRKKYSDTDWSIASEKFGMPFLVVRTQSRQDNELDAKENMAKNFGTNGYAILDDADEINMLERSNGVNAHLVYFERIKYADEQIAKIINGQNSTSDVKSFVGSAEVHERILNDFSFARMTRIEYNINFVLFPFLIRHGYPLSGYRFEFKELVEKEKEATEQAPPDRTGNKPPDKNLEDVKKKSRGEPSRSPKLLTFDGMYRNVGATLAVAQPTVAQLSFKPTTDNVSQDFLDQVYNGTLSKNDIHKELTQTTFDNLWKSVANGLDRNLDVLDINDPDYEMLSKLRQSCLNVATAKSLTLTKKLHDIATMPDGSKRNLEDYTRVGKHQIDLFQGSYMKTEMATAAAAARAAEQWKEIWEDREDFPYLRYVAVHDDRTRNTHKVLDGTELPVEDEFWKKYFPPNGYNCRCTIMKLAQGTDRPPKAYPSEKEQPPELAHNPGIGYTIVNESKHPYFRDKPDDFDRTAHNFAARAEGIKDLVYTAQNGKTVTAIPFYKDLEEYNYNIEKSMIIADTGDNVTILGYSKAINVKNPDIMINGKIADIKEPITDNLKQAFKNSAKKAKAQGAKVLVFVFNNQSLENLLDQLRYSFSNPEFATGITDIYIIVGNVVSKYNRSLFFKQKK
jgi:SPP1 gp7 family putative phage head morphogenesis protein